MVNKVPEALTKLVCNGASTVKILKGLLTPAKFGVVTVLTLINHGLSAVPILTVLPLNWVLVSLSFPEIDRPYNHTSALPILVVGFAVL